MARSQKSRKYLDSPLKTRRKGQNARQNRSFASKRYHLLFNWGVDHRTIFNSKEDYDRFEAYLYLLNAIESPRASNLFASKTMGNIFDVARGEKLVGIGAYTFSSKEFFILATPLVEGGIAKFMQKLQTAYTMYFNLKYQRSGSLFQARYKSEIAESDEMLKKYFSKVHLSAARLFDDTWEDRSGVDLMRLAASAMKYRYSSANEYITGKFCIVSPEEYPRYLQRTRDAQAHLRFWQHDT